MHPNSKKPTLPEETWSVNKEEKEQIVELGRRFNKFIMDYIQEKQVKNFHLKLVAGAFQYFMEIQRSRSRLISDDVIILSEVIENYGLAGKIEEPFQEPEPIEVETKEQTIARLRKQLEDLEKSETPVDTDVADAMNAPSNKPFPMEGPESTPA